MKLTVLCCSLFRQMIKSIYLSIDRDIVDVKYEDESSPAVILKMNGEIGE